MQGDVDEECRTCKNEKSQDFRNRTEIYLREGGYRNEETAEVLDQTETFETAGFDILNHVGKIPTQVDMPMEYGRVCLAEQVGKHAALFLDFTQELDTVEEFILRINENCKRQSIPVEMRDLYELASSEKLLPEIKRYLTAEMAVRITEAAGLEKLVSISGIRYLNSREVMFSGDV